MAPGHRVLQFRRLGPCFFQFFGRRLTANVFCRAEAIQNEVVRHKATERKQSTLKLGNKAVKTLRQITQNCLKFGLKRDAIQATKDPHAATLEVRLLS